MGGQIHPARSVWRLVRQQHGVIARSQLLAYGYTRHAIYHRIARRRLHPVYAGVFAVGRPELTRLGQWMAAVLACGPGAVLSHHSAAALWRIAPDRGGPIAVSLPRRAPRRRRGIRVHRRASLAAGDVTHHRGIPVTNPVVTLIDLAATASRDEAEAAINEADKHDLIDPEALRRALDGIPEPGARKLRLILDRDTFVATHTWLERHFVPIARRAGLPKPVTQRYLGSSRVDFFFPELGLVVEVDGLRYHRTAGQQGADLRRSNAHAASDLAPLRFSHGQVRYEPAYVEETLRAVATRRRRG